MSEILRYDCVEIKYNGVPVVQDVSVALEQGEILGVVGESGSGKSTLLKAAMGLLEGGTVTRGDIWFEGKSIPDMKEKELREIRGAKIGMIFQDCGASFCPIRTIGSQVCESMSAHGKVSKTDAKAKAMDLFAKLHFKDPERIWNSHPFELSGGMNQRVGIAIAMLTDPKILLADEPTSALDVGVQQQVIAEMKSLREMYHTSIILVTHDIGVVSALADHILVLKDGMIQEYGDADTVLRHPSSAYTQKLLQAVPRLKRA